MPWLERGLVVTLISSLAVVHIFGYDLPPNARPCAPDNPCDVGEECVNYPVDSSSYFCFPCGTGQWCPEGASNPLNSVHSNLCPGGSFCPTPALRLECPCGYFCPEAIPSYQPYECSKPGLYCPNGSVTAELCPAGTYCPNATLSFLCPKGYYCPEGYTSPRSCALWSACPAGSTHPSVSHVGLAVGGGLFVLMGLMFGAFALYNLQSNWRLAARMRRKFHLYELLSAFFGHSLTKRIDTYRLTGFSKVPTVDLAFSDLRLTLRNGRCILEGVSGKFDAGRLVAVMGPSGAGKSTFLNVLCGKATYGKMEGTVRINGLERPISSIRKRVGFVPQDDIVHSNLTVLENLYYNAFLRLPSKMPNEQKRNIIDDVIRILNLEHVANSIVGDVEDRGISGGQRKRVNIGIELVSSPSVLFLDEPTSGLDATAASEVLSALKKLTKLGVLVIAVVHQPRYSIFTMFDDVLLLGKGGRTVYLGPSISTADYFADIGFTIPPNENPADFFLDVINGDVGLKDDSAFKAEDLFTLWEERGRAVPAEGREARHRGVSVDSPLMDETDLAAEVDHAVNALVSKTDESGQAVVLGQKEVQEMLVDLGYECSEREAQMVVEYVDDDADGVVSPHEFAMALRDLLRISRPASVDALSPKGGRSFNRAMYMPLSDGMSEDAGPSTSIQVSRSRAMSTNLEKRKTPSFLAQFSLLTKRAALQTSRGRMVILLDWFLLLFGACAVGLIYGTSYSIQKYGTMCLITLLTFGLFTVISSIRVLGSERVIHWRERGAGINVLAYFLSKCISQVPGIILRPVLFVSLYYTFVLPKTSFVNYTAVMWCVSWATSGIGLLISTIFRPQTAMVVAVVIPMVTCGVLSGVDPSLTDLYETAFGMRYITSVSYGRWAVEALLIKEIEAQPEQFQEYTRKWLDKEGFDTDNFVFDLIVLGAFGLGTRILAYFCLLWQKSR